MPSLVTEPAEVDAIAGALARAPLVAFDLEFASADRLIPALCLVQVAWLEGHGRLDARGDAIVAPELRLVDPAAVDVAPIVAALAAHPLVVAHAPRQDLGLLATRFGGGARAGDGFAMPGLVDTQLAAAFCGIGDQVGLATLAGELLGVALAKEQQWTDWEARPLSAAQLAYAEADVRHLPALFGKLAERLGPRLAWVREESAQVVGEAVAAASVTPETAWRGVGGTRGLDEPALVALRAIAAWRQRVAIELDRPLGQVLGDKLIVELARARPTRADDVRKLKGLSPHARTRADELARAIEESGARTVERSGNRTVERSGSRTLSTRAQRWSELLVAIVQVIAEQAQIAPRLLATRADAEEVARMVDEAGLEAAVAALPAFASWRREVLGTVWESWLGGRLALVGDLAAPHGLRLLPRA